MLSFIKDNRLTRVQSKHISLTDFEVARVYYLRGIRYGATHGWTLTDLGTFAMTTVVTIREGGACPALLGKLMLAILVLLYVFLITSSLF